MAEQPLGELQAKPDHTPLLHVCVVLPEATPYVHACVLQVAPLMVAGQVPVPNCGADVMAAHDAPRQTGKADHVPALHVSVVVPDTTPLGHVMLVHVAPLAVVGQEPEPYCGAEIIAHVGALHTGCADHTPLVHVSTALPDATP